jgi:hypothetical protein
MRGFLCKKGFRLGGNKFHTDIIQIIYTPTTGIHFPTFLFEIQWFSIPDNLRPFSGMKFHTLSS